MKQKLVKEIRFESSLILEGSWGEQSLGRHESIMSLFMDDAKERGSIEWEIPDFEDEITEIGLWFGQKWLQEGRAVPYLKDYDGVMSLPKQAVEILERAGVHVGEEFKCG